MSAVRDRVDHHEPALFEGEFSAEGETRASIEVRWEEGWASPSESLASLEPGDLERTITIRGEPHSVMRAIQRNLNHAAYHAGQVVQLARHFAGDAWQTLSIAPGESEEFNAAMRGPLRRLVGRRTRG